MTTVYCISILFRGFTKPFIISEEYNLANVSFFTRGTVKECLRFTFRELAHRTPRDDRQAVEYKHEAIGTFVAFCTCRSDVIAVMIADNYNPRIAFSVLDHAISLFSANDNLTDLSKDVNIDIGLKNLLADAGDPEKMDKIARIRSELDETREILLKSIDNLLVRGEKLEELVKASEDLTFVSRKFMMQAKKMNRCCVIV